MAEKELKFKILAKDRKSAARLGEIKTVHGTLLTPEFIPVGTKGTVKSLNFEQLKKINLNCFFVNTYHLHLQPGEDRVFDLGGLHRFIGWDKLLMTDSGGFQVFSQARNSSFGGRKALVGAETETLVKIDEDGVTFKSFKDGSVHRFTPEKSIEIQKKLGADIILAFDECTYYPATYEYAKKAMERTHRWAGRCLEAFKKRSRFNQGLYGIVQGSVFEDLRKKSARFVGSLPFAGLAIGGVSVGESKTEMAKVLEWVIPDLPEEKSRHLLGVGEIDDIFELVARGIDTFDCVMPTRLARMGLLLVKPQSPKKNRPKGKEFTLDITKPIYGKDESPIESDCRCETCLHHSRAYLNHLFKEKELLAYTLATYHNLWFMARLTQEIRESLGRGSFLKLRKHWLGR